MRPRPRTLGQHMPEIFAVEAERPGDREDEELSKKLGDSIKKASEKKDFCRYGCPKTGCNHRSCRSRVKEISSVERVIQKAKGEFNQVRATLGWERVRVQIDSGSIDTVGRRR